MSDKHNKDHQQQEMARRRLLKANNVQRRRFEIMAEEAIERARAAQRDVRVQEKQALSDKIVKETMGENYHALMEIRRRVQRLKQEIKYLQDRGNTIFDVLRERGLSPNGTYNNYYLDPPANDSTRKDVCAQPGDPTIDMRIIPCRTNPAYAKLEKAMLPLQHDHEILQEAADDLRMSVWQLVTTDEIKEAIEEFRDAHNV